MTLITTGKQLIPRRKSQALSAHTCPLKEALRVALRRRLHTAGYVTLNGTGLGDGCVSLGVHG